MGEYYLLLLGEDLDEAKPAVEAKRELARRLTDRFHGEGAGAAAEQRFDQVHVRGELPDDIPVADRGRRQAGPPAGADRGGVRALLERGTAADDAGRREARRRAGRIREALDLQAERHRRRGAPGRQAPSPSPAATCVNYARATLLHSSVPEWAARLARAPAGGYTCWSRLKRHPRRGRPPRPGKRSLKTEQRARLGACPGSDRSDHRLFGGDGSQPRHVVRDSVYVTNIRHDYFP